MASRKVYVIKENFVETFDIDFEWFPGFAVSQKQKSINSLHNNIEKELNIPVNKILEVSTKSRCTLGQNLSAFNLKTKTQKKKISYSVESAYQSSKVFENGGPYREIINYDSIAAKTDIRLKKSGKLKSFEFYDNKFELHTGTKFYDWLYINVLLQNKLLTNKTGNFLAFTDIEFNHKKSLSTQAFSIALYTVLIKANVNMTDFNKPEVFLEKTKDFYSILQ